MKIALVILAAPNSGLCHFRAQGFAKALEHSSVALQRVFFYGEGVRAAASENTECIAAWAKIAADQSCDLVLCSTSAENHGVLPPQVPFTIMGLGALMEAGHDCDRVVSFG
jgi:sulfur relay (sulfurtransferase) complex TusBCD TusD component (DsrE family)